MIMQESQVGTYIAEDLGVVLEVDGRRGREGHQLAQALGRRQVRQDQLHREEGRVRLLKGCEGGRRMEGGSGEEGEVMMI